MAATTITNLTTANRTIWETKVLNVAEGMLVADKFAYTKVLGRGAAGTWTASRLLRVAKVTSAGTFGTRVSGTAAKALTSNKVSVTPELWQDSFGFDDDVDIKVFFTESDYDKVIGQQMANSLDYQVMKRLAIQGLRHRIDKDATYQVSGTVDSATATTFVDDALTQADDFWNGGYVVITNPDGPGYDEPAAAVSDFVAATDTATIASRENTYTSGSKYRMTVGTGIVATDVLTSDALIDVAGLHEKLETEKFPGGVLHGFLDAAQKVNLWSDSDFINVANVDYSERYGRYSLIRWLDMEFLVSSNLYREDVDGTENQAAGVVYVSPIFGANAYCLIKWGTPGAGNFGVQFHYVFDADSENLTANERYVSWKTSIGIKTLRSTSVVDLMTGATSQNILV